LTTKKERKEKRQKAIHGQGVSVQQQQKVIKERKKKRGRKEK
jgi:hypothetical protein